MTKEEEIDRLKARVLVLEAETKRHRGQLQKAYRQRADIHKQLREVTGQLAALARRGED